MDDQKTTTKKDSEGLTKAKDWREAIQHPPLWSVMKKAFWDLYS